ncbi:MAG: DUF3298 domain-containing protein [Siphonobacter aquaeclarae]|jgi:hypothetical protein|nr:DUF3298 domain-containing protein [Siphonobacter aquaeclarae]
MKKLPLLLAAPLLWLAACESKKGSSETSESTADTLHYAVTADSVKSKTCIRPDSLCATASFAYPVFDGNKALNDSILRDVLTFSGFFDGESTPEELKKSTPKSAMSDFVGGFDDFVADQRKRFPKEPIMGGVWTNELKANVLYQTKDMIAVSYFNFIYSGGAHPNTNTSYANYHRDGRKVRLSELFQAGYEPKLAAVAEKIFRAQEGLKAGEPLGEKYFFEGGRFVLNDNFSIRPDGILFHYNPYEIKSYAEGPTDLFLPNAELKALRK